MEAKEYQQRALKHFEDYLSALAAEQAKKRKIAEVGLDIPYDVPVAAWKAIGLRAVYNSWQNGLDKDIPSVCFKVPTGGGKTYMATRAIELINLNFRQSSAGFVLWIVPSTQIYRQTLSALRNREHPYRQTLDRASGGRTLILEKTDRFTPQHVGENLVVMILMLPSANRRDKEALKVFQDSSGFEVFFPPEDNGPAQLSMLKRFPNLDYYGTADQWTGITLKTSLGNTLRVLEPVVVIDEGHKTYSETARQTIRTLNPCFVLELSATPTAESNVLVSVSGQDLHREEMIKLDLNIISKASPDWRDTLLAGFTQTQLLQEAATVYQANGGRYIRPICLIQVERTGKSQDTGQHIHANDARNFLIQQCGVSPSKIAVKSAENDGLEDIDLLSLECPIQYIITKSALQEGWDCAFAYTLVVLTNPTSESGITQLVGRVLRQPYARKTRVRLLDESYVFCYQRRAKSLLLAVQQSFEQEGLGDMKGRTHARSDGSPEYEEVRYRSQFKKFEGSIYLPRFVIQETDCFRDLSYEMDILSRIDWSQVDLSQASDVTLSALEEEDQRARITLSDDPHRPAVRAEVTSERAVLEIEPAFITQQLSEIVPNPWIAHGIVQRTLASFLKLHPYERVASDQALIVTRLKQVVTEQRDRLSAHVFNQLLQTRRLCFFLQAATGYALPSVIRTRADAPKLTRDNNDPTQLSLFDHEPEDDFNETEKAVAIYLDKQARMLWWYRNMVGPNSYRIQGWQKHGIYADFVAAVKDPEDETDYNKVFVLETKGLHLKGNADTEYKRNIFDLCNQLGRSTDWDALGEEFGQKYVEFQVIYEDEWQARINEMLKSVGPC
jgi:type III restriction enzyme